MVVTSAAAGRARRRQRRRRRVHRRLFLQRDQRQSSPRLRPRWRRERGSRHRHLPSMERREGRLRPSPTAPQGQRPLTPRGRDTRPSTGRARRGRRCATGGRPAHRQSLRRRWQRRSRQRQARRRRRLRIEQCLCAPRRIGRPPSVVTAEPVANSPVSASLLSHVFFCFCFAFPPPSPPLLCGASVFCGPPRWGGCPPTHAPCFPSRDSPLPSRAPSRVFRRPVTAAAMPRVARTNATDLAGMAVKAHTFQGGNHHLYCADADQRSGSSAMYLKVYPTL